MFPRLQLDEFVQYKIQQQQQQQQQWRRRQSYLFLYLRSDMRKIQKHKILKN